MKKQPKAAQAQVPEQWRQYLALAVIIIISFIAYWPALQNGFVWDDQYYIITNTLLKPVNLAEIFSQNVGGNYHPLTILALAAEFHFFGLDETGYHAVNLFLHLLNVILVFYMAFLLSDKSGVALVTALLFGIHPLHVESVAWVSELKDLLYAFFFLGAYIFYLEYLRAPQKKYYVFALLLFSLSLLSKAMAASLPVLLMLTDYFKGRKMTVKTLVEKIPFFLLAIAAGVVAVIAQKNSNFIQDSSVFNFPQRIVFACYGFITYLFNLLLPVQLSAYYPYPVKEGDHIPILYYAYVILFSGLAAYVIHSLRGTKKLFFGLGFFTVTVFLVLQLLPVGGAIMADRYSYIPSIGIFYLAGEGVYFLWGKKLKWVAIVLVSVSTIFFTMKTFARCSVWKNGMSLWTDVIGQYQTIPQAYYNRGLYYLNHGGDEEALKDFNKTIELAPAHFEAFNSRGNIYMNHNLDDQALKDFNKAVELKPDYGNAYHNRGILFMKEQKFDQAIADYTKAIDLKLNDNETYINRGYVFMNLGRYEEALDDLNKAIELNPAQAIGYHNRGAIYFTVKRYEEAIADYSKAIALNPGYTEAYYNRGLAEFYAGKKEAACADVKHAAGLGSKPAADAMLLICQ
jgi:protein O-mannosyl-transferase